MKKTADQIVKETNQRINQKKGSSRLKAFDGVSKELERIKLGFGVAFVDDKLPGLKAMLNFTINNDKNMNLETFQKAEFNQRCTSSIEEMRKKLILPTGGTVDYQSVTINTASGKNISFPGDCPFPHKDDLIYTQRFREKMDFVGKAFINMLLQACDEELEILKNNFKNLKDYENGEAKSNQ